MNCEGKKGNFFKFRLEPKSCAVYHCPNILNRKFRSVRFQNEAESGNGFVIAYSHVHMLCKACYYWLCSNVLSNVFPSLFRTNAVLDGH